VSKFRDEHLFSFLLLNNIDAQIANDVGPFKRLGNAQIMYNPKNERCATVLQKMSKLPIVIRKRQSGGRL